MGPGEKRLKIHPASAVHSAGEADSPWRGLVVLASFDSYDTVVRHQVCSKTGPGPGSLLMKGVDMAFRMKTGLSLEAVRPVRIAPSIRIPTLIAHGTNDGVVPFDAGQRLGHAFTGAAPMRWIEVPGADHDNLLITGFPIYAEIAAWMLDYVPARGDQAMKP